MYNKFDPFKKILVVKDLFLIQNYIQTLNYFLESNSKFVFDNVYVTYY